MKSNVFRMGRWRCYLMMLVFQAPAVGWIMLAVIAGLTTAGFILSPWIGIASIGFDIFILMLGFSFVILAYGFNSISGVNMSLHSLAIDGDTLKIEFEEARNGDGEAAGAAKADSIVLPLASLRPYHIYPGGVLIPVEGLRKGWLWVPPRAFDTDNNFQTFLLALYHPSSPPHKGIGQPSRLISEL